MRCDNFCSVDEDKEGHTEGCHIEVSDDAPLAAPDAPDTTSGSGGRFGKPSKMHIVPTKLGMTVSNLWGKVVDESTVVHCQRQYLLHILVESGPDYKGTPVKFHIYLDGSRHVNRLSTDCCLAWFTLPPRKVDKKTLVDPLLNSREP